MGIGVATGADAVFVGSESDLDVEPSRRLPLFMTDDIRTGQVCWSGHWVLNPFEADGSLASLTQYPRFKRYIEGHATVLRARNVATRNPASWYRTIDRIHPWLTSAPKLLIPDIKGSAHVVIEEGQYYPHHNLYYVLSGKWPLQALAAVLRSRIAYQFVALYCPPLRGGFLRFQAQYMRRIRLPQWTGLDEGVASSIS